jgi:hypothetical protein
MIKREGHTVMIAGREARDNGGAAAAGSAMIVRAGQRPRASLSSPLTIDEHEKNTATPVGGKGATDAFTASRGTFITRDETVRADAGEKPRPGFCSRKPRQENPGRGFSPGNRGKKTPAGGLSPETAARKPRPGFISRKPRQENPGRGFVPGNRGKKTPTGVFVPGMSGNSFPVPINSITT